MFIFSGFAAMLGYAIIMYFSMVLEFSYSYWYLPMFLKGYGMGALLFPYGFIRWTNLRWMKCLLPLVWCWSGEHFWQ